jgi:hypothetical protein
MISARFAPVVCALAGVALIPTFIHSYAGFTITDGRSTSAIPATLAGYTSRPSDRNATWGQRRFESIDWVERVYESGADRVRLTVVRSFDLKSLYHHPELAVAYGTGFRSAELARFSSRPEVPVFVLAGSGRTRPVGMYVLHYDDEFVEAPILFQIRTAGELLVSGRRAMTLFFVTDVTGRSSPPSGASPAAAVLFGAIDSFLGASDHPPR